MRELPALVDLAVAVDARRRPGAVRLRFRRSYLTGSAWRQVRWAAGLGLRHVDIRQ